MLPEARLRRSLSVPPWRHDWAILIRLSKNGAPGKPKSNGQYLTSFLARDALIARDC